MNKEDENKYRFFKQKIDQLDVAVHVVDGKLMSFNAMSRADLSKKLVHAVRGPEHVIVRLSQDEVWGGGVKILRKRL